MRHRLLWLAFSLLIVPFTSAGEYDWPQWQGIDRNALSREKGLLQEWPKEGPKLVWTADNLGQNYCTPSISGGRIFLMGNRENTEQIIALAEKDGKELWAYDVGPVRHGGGGYPGPRCSPTVDGGLLYALGLNGDLVCLDVETGKVVWRKHLARDFKGRAGGWGSSESPLIDGERLLCTPGGTDATLVALEKKTGELIWKAALPKGQSDHAHYSSIIAPTVDGKRQYIQFLSGGVVGFSDEGKFLWRYNKPANGTANCSTPLYYDHHVFAASSYGVGGGLVKLTRDGDKWDAKQVYFTKDMKNHHGGMVRIGEYLYGSNEGELVCLHFKTGEIMWHERRPGKGSICYADGRLYYRNEGGPVYLIAANSEKYVEHGRFSPPRSRAPAWPHPVVANGKLYIQDQDKLMCYDVKR